MATAQEGDATCDSRTASVGLPQSRNKDAPKRTRRAPKKRRGGKRNRGGHRDVQDFIPKGTTFTNSPLGTDESPAATQDAKNANTEHKSNSGLTHTQPSAQPVRAATNWNNIRKGAVRTTLRGPDSAPANTSNSFRSINGTYWRSRSASASTTGSEAQHRTTGSNVDDQTDDSGSGAEMDKDNSIVLNIDPPHRSESPTEEAVSKTPKSTPIDPHSLTYVEAEPPSEIEIQSEAMASKEKEAAIQSFDSKYMSLPRTLAELDSRDLEMQAKYVYYYNEPSAERLDLALPVRCTECLEHGHLAGVCPYKNCEHCSAWGVHESRFCPRWRRCQKCRERGHDKEACTAPLQGSASEVPCDLCGSDQHLESECDLMWKMPQSNLNVGQIFISVCCAHCTSPQHLIGDCPRRQFSMNSSSWSLKTFDPAMISNISHVPYTGKSDGPRGGKSSNFRVKGRAHQQRESSPEDDGFFAGPDRWAPINQDPPNSRTHIRFAEGIGRGRGLGPNSSRPPPNPVADSYVPHDYRRDYRDREQYFGSGNRQRSLSPDMNGSRQRGASGNQYIPPKSQPGGGRGRGQPSSRGYGRGRGGGGGPSGRGRGSRSSPSRTVYRPMPSVGKRKNKRNS